MISNLGNVFSKHTHKCMTQYMRGKYLRISLTDDKLQKKQMVVHRLVATSFIPNMENKSTVNHVDHNSLNNMVTNLEWATVVEQNIHRRKYPRHVKQVVHVDEDEHWFLIPFEIIGTNGYYITRTALIKTPRGVIIHGTVRTEGYITVHINKKNHSLHILMAKIFLDNPNHYAEYVNHIDGNKSNANIDNLEWCSPSWNVQHAIEYDLIRSCVKVTFTNVNTGEKRKFNSLNSTSRLMRVCVRTISKFARSKLLFRDVFLVEILHFYKD
jgi:hypothetical protein